jgi:7,8-dihydropterin-6-yl-methyl-4-(beta-D-ribofuranosyl)aminobenzene 5'-phosphate synthase
MFLRRGLRLPSGVVIPFADMPSPPKLEQAGGALNLDPSSRLIADGAGLLGGPIPRTRPHEIGFPGHVRWDESRSDWVDDPLIEDERWFAVKIKGRGALVFSACSHAGIGNVLADAQAAFRGTPVFAVMGGFHLAGPSGERAIEATVQDLHSFKLEQIVPAHCTGWRAQMALVQAFGDRVVPSAVGQTYIF